MKESEKETAPTNLVLILPQTCPSDVGEAVRAGRSVWGTALEADIERRPTCPQHNTWSHQGSQAGRVVGLSLSDQ